jgi:hypothetical protein
MLKRTTLWQRQFHVFLLERSTTPFAWGANDCALFSADAIQSFTGQDIADDFRGKYTTQIGAFKTVKSITGGSTVADAALYCATKHGLTEHTHSLMAKRGDLVLVDNGGELIAGVVHLNGYNVVSVNEKGIVRLPITAIKRSWSV